VTHLADHVCRIVGRALQISRQERKGGVQVLRSHTVVKRHVDSRVNNVASAHDRGARRAADWLVVEHVQRYAALEDGVNVRCRNLRAAVKADVVVAQIICGE
jgi:hypothetical protein